MLAPPHFGTTAYSLAAVFAWGTSDFLGGYASRRANSFVFTAVFSMGGLVALGILVAATHAPIPSRSDLVWGVLGGMSGGAGVAIFFRALASGSMGLNAPVAAVLGAAIPTLFSMLTEGWPGPVRIGGFVLAALGLWLITRSDDGGTPQGLGLAMLAGIGFAGFYLCVRQSGDVPALWVATLTRIGGLVVTGAIVLAQGRAQEIVRIEWRLAVITGCIDSLGTLLFVHASQSGRLDEAVVLSSLYPTITVLLARVFLKEHFTRWKLAGLLAALASVPMIAAG